MVNKRAAKKKTGARKYVIAVVVILVGLIVFSIIGGRITGYFVKEKRDEKVVIYFPKSTDFPSSKQGTVEFHFSFPDASFRVGNKTADFLIFLSSETIPGLKIGYNTQEKKIYAGIPLLISNEVTILDSQMHKLTYRFSREHKIQGLFLDDKLLIEGKFTGEIGKDNLLTGYAVHQKWKQIESNIPVKVRFE
jgi:hypothetical protein